MSPLAPWLAAAAGFALAYWVGFSWRAAESWPKSALKTLSVALLALAALVHGGPGLLVAGLALGATGDWWLSRPGERAFLTGLVAFAAAHLAYIALFLGAGQGANLAGWRLWAAPGLIVFAGAMAVLLWPRAGALRLPVMGYIAVIVLMGLAALTLPAQGGGRLAIWGAFGFIASDAVLAAQLFLLPEGRAGRAASLLVWPLYWGAQAAFLLAFLPG